MKYRSDQMLQSDLAEISDEIKKQNGKSCKERKPAYNDVILLFT